LELPGAKNMSGKILKLSIYLNLVFLLFSSFLGYSMARMYPEAAQEVLKLLAVNLDFVKNLDAFHILLFIFLNNSLKSLLVILLGFFFGVVPLFFITFNGYLIGIVLAVSLQKLGFLETLASVAPHGIFELSGVVYSSGLGVWLGIRFYERLRHEIPFKPYFIFALKRFLMIAAPLLFISAMIEAYFTPLVVQYLAK
jgi:stage II sporulation protein M